MTTLRDLLAMEQIDFKPIEERLTDEIPGPERAGRVIVIGLGVVDSQQAEEMVAAGDAFPAGHGFALTRQGLRRRRGLDLEARAGDGQPSEEARRMDLLLHAGFLSNRVELVAVPEPKGGPTP